MQDMDGRERARERERGVLRFVFLAYLLMRDVAIKM